MAGLSIAPGGWSFVPAHVTESTSDSLNSLSLGATLLIIDPGVSDYEVLIAAATPGTEVYRLDKQSDGIEQITAYLKHYPASTVHILAHGAPGQLQLGNGELNLENLDTYTAALATWFQGNKAALLLYGCNVAAGDTGTEFLEKLHQLTGATLAASTREIGNGIWALDAPSPTDALPPIPIAPTALAAYPHTLNSPPIGLDPANPTLISTYQTPDTAYGVSMVGHYAYVAVRSSGLQVIDISTPTHPRLVGTVDTPGLAMGVSVVGHYAYVADYHGGLQIIDISTPANPILVNTVDTRGLVVDVSVVGRYAYVADRIRGLQIIDISTPTNPILVGTCQTPGIRDISVVGRYAYVAHIDCLQVIDISTPTNPTLVGTTARDDTTPGFVNGVSVVGHYAYIADSDYGLQIFDIRTPANPTLVGTYNTSALEVSVVGHYAYVSTSGRIGLQVLDVSTPSNPTLVGNYNTFGALDMSVVGGYIYAASSLGLQVIDISEPPITLAGTPQENSPLTAKVSALMDADGLPNRRTYSYQWQQSRDGGSTWSAVAGATARTFVPRDAQVGKHLRVQMQYTDLRGRLETVTSAATRNVVNVNDAPTGRVTITGTATQGQILTASNTLADRDGLGPITYQWRADGANITGATRRTLRLTQDHVGKAISVVARYTDGFGTPEAVASAPTAPVNRPLPTAQVTTLPNRVLSVTGNTPTLTLAFDVSREARFDNTVGFYTVLDTRGRVRDPLTGNALLPGAAGYQRAALANRVVSNLATQNGQTSSYTATVATNQLLSSFLVVGGSVAALLDSNPNNDPRVFFNYRAANGDRQDHVRLLGPNTLGFEDIFGGGDRDFNDVIVRTTLA